MSDEEVNLIPNTEGAPEAGADLGLEKKEEVEVKEVVKEKPEAEPQVEQEQEKPQEIPEVSVPAAAPAQPTQAPIKKDELLEDIEGLLADDLTEVFLQLPDDKKLAFKQKGEEVARKVRESIETGKLKIGKVLGWIQDWLKMIPGVNKYFINQEAKIKADKILQYEHDQKKRLQNKV